MNKQKIIIGVVGLPVRNSNGTIEYLLTCRHAPYKPTFHNHWQLAGGGMMFGETPEETLVRELKEEIDVTPTILYPQPMAFTNTWIGGDDDTRDDVHIVLLNYIVTIGNQIPKVIDPDHETNNLGWFTYEQIKNLEMLPKTLKIVETSRKIIEENGLKF